MKGARMLVLFVAAGIVGCASAGNSLSATDSNVISQEEIVRVSPGNAYEVIRRLRPKFLLGHGSTTLEAQGLSAYPKVYLDGLTYGDINSLRNLDATQISEVRMYSPAEAQNRFGTGNSNGVIAITSRK